MGKKIVSIRVLVFLGVLVWPLTAGAAEANLQGWWKLDGNGLDSSGNGRNGSLVKEAHYEAGHIGQALALDGQDDAFTVAGYKGIFSTSPVTVAAWVNTTGAGDQTVVYWGRNANGRRVDFRLGAGRLRVECGGGNLQADTTLNDGEWHHVALAMPPGAPISYPDVKLYLDGRDDTRNTQDAEGDRFNLATNAANVDLTFGYRAANGDRYFAGRIDEVRLYDRELVQVEIEDLLRYGYLARARSPSILDGGQYDNPWANLEWTGGPLAAYHNVYFGTSFEDVNAGAQSVFVAKVTGNSQLVGVAGYPVPNGLVPGTTYYWRVDAVNEANPDSPWRGPVWSFWVPQHAAYRPYPADGEPFEDTNVVLSWMPGLRAIFGTVYFGTDPNQVAGAANGQPLMTTTYNPGPLQPGTTYYWRADTFNGDGWVKGDVWSFTTVPAIPLAADPSLVAWWPLDEGVGARIVDRSGHGHHGRFDADVPPTWVPGYEGTALSFAGAGSGCVVTTYPGVTGTQSRSMTAWIKTPTIGEILSWGQNVAGQKWIFRVQETNGTIGAIRVEVNGGYQVGWTDVRDDEWHHVAAVLNSDGTPDALEIALYVDGWAEPISASQATAIDTIDTGVVRLGESPWHGRYFTGLMDDVRIYDKALTADEIELILRIDPLRAWKPEPRSGAVLDIRSLPPLTWVKGDGASRHDVYFGTDANAVAGANVADTTGTYRKRISTTSFTPAESLQWGRTYFWRIDEVGTDGSIVTGKVWTFTVADYLPVDDFESYDDRPGNEIFKTWIGGDSDGLSNSLVGLFPDAINGTFGETTIVHSGRQSMPMDYNNTKAPFYSEAARDFAPAQDWTVYGVDTLVLYLCGVATNTAGPVYVAVQDSAGHTARFVHPDPEVVRQTQWQQWSIPLADLRAAGVNTKSIKKVFLGVGDRDKPLPDGAGRLYIDAIRLTIAPKPQ